MTQYAQPTQTAVKVEELRLPGIDGMLPGGEVKGRKKKPVEYLVEGADIVLKKYRNDYDKGRSILYKRVEDLLKDVKFEVADLETFVDINIDYKADLYEKAILGSYSGCLLELLTRRNRAEGKETKVYINGNWGRFDDLFYDAEQVDELVVENFKGNNICRNIGTGDNGRVNKLVVNNIDGIGTAENVGGWDGSAGLVVVANSWGKEVASNIGYNKGNVDCYVGVNNGGPLSAHQAGGKNGYVGSMFIINHKPAASHLAIRIASEEGNAEFLMYVNNESHIIGSHLAAEKGNIGLVAAVKNKGMSIINEPGYKQGHVGLVAILENNGSLAVSEPGKENGNVDTILIADSKGYIKQGYQEHDLHGRGAKEYFVVENDEGEKVLTQPEGESNLNKLVLHNNRGDDFAICADISQKIEGQEAEQFYNDTIQQYKLREMAGLAESLTDESTTDEIVDVAEQLYTIYKTIQPKVKELMKK